MPSEGTGDLQLIASNIQRGMREKGISSRGLAKALGVGETTVWKWTTARSAPHSARNLPALAKLLFDGDIKQLYWPLEDSAA